jgi:hypothetical protein
MTIQDEEPREWSAEARALLLEESTRPGPSAADVAQTWAALSEPVSAAVKTAVMAAWVKWLGTAAVLGTTGTIAATSVAVVHHRRADGVERHLRAKLSELETENAELRARPPGVLSCPAATECVPVVREREVYNSSLLDSERRLLSQAQVAMTNREVSAAEKALAEYRRRFPAGRLREEHDALEIRLLAATRQEAVAAAKARRFLQRYPASLLRGDIEQILGTDAGR